MPSFIKTASKMLQYYINKKYPGWSLDVSLRYLPITEYLNRINPEKVLDVGAGPEGLSRYWGRSVFELDLSFPKIDQEHSLQRVQGTAAALPFKHSAFDAVVCMDVIEHIPGQDREQVINELLRISKKHLIISFPCGIKAEEADRILNEIHQQQTGFRHPFLGDHLDFGLPNADRLAETICQQTRRQGKKAKVVITKNVNVRLWQWLFKQYLTGGPKIQKAISYYFLLFIPIFRHFNWGATYRKIFFIKID